jgi:hypothetical protein
MLPVYRLVINEDMESQQEVSAVALVDNPAIQEGFFAFKKQERFAVTNEEERIVVGPAMVPDMLIYRKDEDNGEYNVLFDAKTIELIAIKFFTKGFQKNGNEMHNEAAPVDLVFFQSWIADEKKGIPKMKQFEHLPDGTWFLGGKINSEDTWQSVKDGTFRGFSVEGIFDMKPVQMRTADDIVNQLKELLRDL